MTDAFIKSIRDSFFRRHSRRFGGPELRCRMSDGSLLDYGYFDKRELTVIGFHSHLNFLVGFNSESRREVYHQAKDLSRLDLLQANLCARSIHPLYRGTEPSRQPAGRQRDLVGHHDDWWLHHYVGAHVDHRISWRRSLHTHVELFKQNAKRTFYGPLGIEFSFSLHEGE